jgi:signal transduction histidine kinase
MLTGILFLILVLAVAVLITADVIRTPSDAPAWHADRYVPDPERAIAGVPGGTGVRTFPREPAVRETPAPASGVRLGARPVELDSFERPDAAARSFDQMRREASQSAASEAALRGKFNAMYGNLSRRSQALVERQLRIIESLEHGEQDPERLVGLAKLNRIAMRMHRNSQNLLVLAGQEPGTGWNQPVTLANVVEAALAEIEDYQRVSSEVQPGIAVRGPAVHDAVHVLVELIDNATSFSSAEMPVHVKGRILTTGGALVDITDRGIGMPAKEMAYANQQLDNPPPPDIDVPKWMGLLVVARLAARHGIRVRLTQAELGGLTARVWFPDEILTHYSVAADPGRAAGGQRGAAVAPPALASARMSAPGAPAATRPDPAWSARSPQPALQAELPAAARLSGSVRPDALSGDAGVVMPPAQSQARLPGPPIFDEVESRWSKGGRGAPTSVSLAAAPSPAAVGPMAAGPAAPGPAPSGLPRRPSAAPAGSRTVPGTPPGAPNRAGLPSRQGRAAPAEEANPGAEDES